jgi:rhodanese-related sulfurtransferase/TfoX/Sxy family transcriptional regulator of competence genes
MRSLDPADAWRRAQAGELRILDVRTRLERRLLGAPPGSVHVSLPRHLAEPEGDGTAYLCQHALRSKLTLRKGAAEVAGGFKAWSEAGLPVEYPGRWATAYDEQLAARIRDLVSAEAGVTEKKMFGGLAFLVDGNMAVAASGQGGLLVRVDPAESAELVQTTAATEMEMRGRSMAGWLRLESATVEADDELSAWVARGVTFARSLPPK